jgi:hypothetical protein
MAATSMVDGVPVVHTTDALPLSTAALSTEGFSVTNTGAAPVGQSQVARTRSGKVTGVRPGTVQPAGVIPTVVSPPTMSSQRTPSIAHPSRGPIAASRRPVATSRAKTSPASNRPLSSACGSAVGSRPTTVAARSMMAVSSTATSRLTHPVRRNAVHAGSAATAGNSSPSWPRRETSLRARAAAFAARCASRRPVECAATTPGVSGAKRSASEARSRRVRCPATRWRRPRSPAATARPATSLGAVMVVVPCARVGSPRRSPTCASWSHSHARSLVTRGSRRPRRQVPSHRRQSM